MNKTLIELYKKAVAIAEQFKHESFHGEPTVSIEVVKEKVLIEVKWEDWRYGDADYEIVRLTAKDLEDVEGTIKRKKKEEAERLRLDIERREADKKLLKKKEEEAERELFEKLKLKFNKPPND